MQKLKDIFIFITACCAISAFVTLYAKLAVWWLEKTILFAFSIISKTKLFKK